MALGPYATLDSIEDGRINCRFNDKTFRELVPPVLEKVHNDARASGRKEEMEHASSSPETLRSYNERLAFKLSMEASHAESRDERTIDEFINMVCEIVREAGKNAKHMWNKNSRIERRLG